MERPDGYPYFSFRCVTERPEFNKEEDREVSYYEDRDAVIDFCTIDPIFWYQYRVLNPESGKLELCVVLDYTDVHGNPHEIMIAEPFKKFDARIRQWIEYAAQSKND